MWFPTSSFFTLLRGFCSSVHSVQFSSNIPTLSNIISSVSIVVSHGSYLPLTETGSNMRYNNTRFYTNARAKSGSHGGIYDDNK